MAGISRLCPKNRFVRLVLYGLPGLALALPVLPAQVYLPALYADTLGLGLYVTGFAIVAARLVDVFSDPVIGCFSDRVQTPVGKRRPFILAGLPLAGFALIALFSPPENVNAYFLSGWLVCLFLGWTLVAVPYMAWGADLTKDYHDRSAYMGTREGFGLLGMVAASVIPAYMTANGATITEALGTVAVFAVVFGGVAFAVALLFLPETGKNIAKENTVNPQKLAQQVKNLFKQRNARVLLSCWFFNNVANGMASSLFILFMSHHLKLDEEQMAIMVLAYFIAGIAALPLWQRISRKSSKHTAWQASLLLAVIGFMFAPLLPQGAFVGFLVVCVVTGAALGGDIMLPPSMQGDVVDVYENTHGSRTSGMIFSFWSLATKLGLALSAGLALPLVGFGGLQLQDAAPVPLVLGWVYALVPCVIKLWVVARMRAYKS